MLFMLNCEHLPKKGKKKRVNREYMSYIGVNREYIGFKKHGVTPRYHFGVKKEKKRCSIGTV